MPEQFARNTDGYWDAAFHRAVQYMSIMICLILTPWLVLSILVMVSLLIPNSGMTGLFQSIGLHPHTTYETLRWTVIAGAFLAMAWLSYIVFRELGLLLNGADIPRLPSQFDRDWQRAN